MSNFSSNGNYGSATARSYGSSSARGSVIPGTTRVIETNTRIMEIGGNQHTDIPHNIQSSWGVSMSPPVVSSGPRGNSNQVVDSFMRDPFRAEEETVIDYTRGSVEYGEKRLVSNTGVSNAGISNSGRLNGDRILSTSSYTTPSSYTTRHISTPKPFGEGHLLDTGVLMKQRQARSHSATPHGVVQSGMYRVNSSPSISPRGPAGEQAPLLRNYRRILSLSRPEPKHHRGFISAKAKYIGMQNGEAVYQIFETVEEAQGTEDDFNNPASTPVDATHTAYVMVTEATLLADWTIHESKGHNDKKLGDGTIGLQVHTLDGGETTPGGADELTRWSGPHHDRDAAAQAAENRMKREELAKNMLRKSESSSSASISTQQQDPIKARYSDEASQVSGCTSVSSCVINRPG